MSAPRLHPARERHWVCAQRLRERRLTLGLTQREVVARLQRRGNYTTNRALSAMENGRGLDLGMLPELADALGCTVTYLLGLTSDPAAWEPGPAVQPAPAGPANSPPAGTHGEPRPTRPPGFAGAGGILSARHILIGFPTNPAGGPVTLEDLAPGRALGSPAARSAGAPEEHDRREEEGHQVLGRSPTRVAAHGRHHVPPGSHQRAQPDLRARHPRTGGPAGRDRSAAPSGPRPRGRWRG